MKNFEKGKEMLRKILLTFVIFSIGFAFGKHSMPDKVDKAQKAPVTTGQTGESLVRLYYMHAMFRCITCNKIEEQALQLTKDEFANQLSNKILAWEEVNFQENEVLAEKFDVHASCIVVAVVKNGKIESFERLDDVWTLLEKPEEFKAYVRTAINKALVQLKG
jgi:hypothetical protein